MRDGLCSRLSLAIVASLLVLAPDAARADSLVAAEAVRLVPQDDRSDVRLRWIASPAHLAVDVLVSRDPEAALAEMTMLAAGVTSGELLVDSAVGGRHYFALRTSQEGEVMRVATRLLPLEGGRNFRDIGGYRSRDGRRVKWGKVYRSGVMNRLSERDISYLDPLEIATIIDFRSSEERDSEPTLWESRGAEIFSRDYASVNAEEGTQSLFSALLSGDATPESMTRAMADSYYQMAIDQRDSYRVLFDRLIHYDSPLLFNCSAGKDRTGIAAALILEALDVPRETLVDDYALSDNYVDFMQTFVEDSSDVGSGQSENPYAFLAQLPPELLMPLMASSPLYIETALQDIEENYGSVLNYIREELEVSDAELSQLRSRLLE